MEAYADAAQRALADPDPWQGFCQYIEHICAMQAGDHGFPDVLMMAFPTAPRVEAARERAYRCVVTLIRHAKEDGRLRSDFTPEDVLMILMANAGVIAATGEAAPGLSQRLVALVLQACPAQGAHLLPPAPTGAQMFRALHGPRAPRGTC